MCMGGKVRGRGMEEETVMATRATGGGSQGHSGGFLAGGMAQVDTEGNPKIAIDRVRRGERGRQTMSSCI